MTLASIAAAAEKVPQLHIVDGVTEQSTYAVATHLMTLSSWLIKMLHLPKTDDAFVVVYALVVFVVAFSVGWLVKMISVAILRHINFSNKLSLYDILVEKHFFIKLCNVIPPLLFVILIQFTLYTHVTLASWLTRVSWVYMSIVLAGSLCTLADGIWEHIDKNENKKRLPLHGIAQVVKIIIWIMTLIVCCAVLVNKSPASLLAGIGAFAAVLMLIFKDSILGLVAGVQLAQNDSLHVGDWIVVPNSNANGTVTEVSLTAVKVTNWDLTVTTVAPYTLITNGFTNYRNMQLSDTRRIQRSYMIDADSVVETTDEMLKEFHDIPLMGEWIDGKLKQKAAGKEYDVNNPDGLVDGTIDTNLGMFRAYIRMYLANNSDISQTSTCFVTTLAQTSAGIPLQIYCFTATSSWLPYEGIMSSVFEHLAVMMHRFHLYTFENPSGRDTIVDGYLSPGKNPEFVTGMPYPFFRNTSTPMNPGIPPAGLYAQSSHYNNGTVQQPHKVWGEPEPKSESKPESNPEPKSESNPESKSKSNPSQQS